MTIQSKSRGNRMKITGSPASAVHVGAPRVDTTAPADGATTSSSAAPAALQSEVLKPAADALRAMPDFDAARVAELRDLLSRGELPFDPARLAGLIQKFHGGR
jgi:negative regulator of flagellin synthesis FlgM